METYFKFTREFERTVLGLHVYLGDVLKLSCCAAMIGTAKGNARDYGSLVWPRTDGGCGYEGENQGPRKPGRCRFEAFQLLRFSRSPALRGSSARQHTQFHKNVGKASNDDVSDPGYHTRFGAGKLRVCSRYPPKVRVWRTYTLG